MDTVLKEVELDKQDWWVVELDKWDWWVVGLDKRVVLGRPMDRLS